MSFSVVKRFFAAILLFCISLSVNAQKKDKGFNFPPDFGKTETTVLIREGSKDKITEAMVAAFEKEYKGKFEAESDIAPKKKNNTETYRYVFFVTEEEQPAQWIGRDRFPATTNYRFGLLDLKTGQAYRTAFLSGAYKKGAKYYAEHLEEFRKENAGN